MTKAVSENVKIFVPFYEELPGELVGLGELVPYQNDYQCVRLQDGTYEFLPASEVGEQRAA